MPSPLRTDVTVVPRLAPDRPFEGPTAQPAPAVPATAPRDEVAVVSPARPMNKADIVRVTREWSKLQLSAQDARGLKESALEIAPKLENNEARAELQRFLQEKVPTL